MAKGKKTGGRQKGTPNKSTSEIREAIATQWQQYRQSGQFEDDLQALDPATRVCVMEKLAQYIAPKMKSMDLDVSHSVSLTIEDRLRQLCEDSDPDN